MQKRPSETLWKEFGAWIKAGRQRLHLSQREAADAVGIDRQQWYRIEAGKSGTRRDTVIAMASALSLDQTEALERAGFTLRDTEQDDIFSMFHRLPPDKQEIARPAIEGILFALMPKDTVVHVESIGETVDELQSESDTSKTKTRARKKA